MGSGGPRELAQAKTVREINPELGKKLSKALNALDGIDAGFKEGREGERTIQMVKIWADACRHIDQHLETLCDMLNKSHQVSLEPGTSGGGRGITPWVMESNDRFDRLEITLTEGEIVVATAGTRTVGKTRLAKVSFEWLELLLVKWMVESVQLKLQ